MIANSTRVALIAIGSASLLVGLVGVFIPVLPTTPFLLLAAACYARASHRLHDALLGSRFPGQYIRDYREGRGMEWRVKAGVVTLLWLTIGYSALVVVDSALVSVLLFAIAVAVTVHLLMLPTRRH